MWVKICGITDATIAQSVIVCAPDAIGLNFYPRSKRCVDIDAARQIVSLLPASITPVGVFVNQTRDEIQCICETCNIQTVQLHGDETPEFAAELSEYQIIRAFRVGSAGLAEVGQELREYSQAGVSLLGCLIDAKVGDAYGGTGQCAPWDVLAANWNPDWPPLILAGGLTPENVTSAISTVSPFGVDVASGVEEAPGRQDPAAVQKLINLARQATVVLPEN